MAMKKSLRDFNGYFIQRHDNVLRLMDTCMRPYYHNKSVLIDLKGKRDYDDSHARSILAAGKTKQKPDIVIVGRESVSIVELTCCLPKNVQYWKTYKREKYSSLAESISSQLVTLEVCTDGSVSDNFIPFMSDVIGMPSNVAQELAFLCGKEAAWPDFIK